MPSEHGVSGQTAGAGLASGARRRGKVLNRLSWIGGPQLSSDSQKDTQSEEPCFRETGRALRFSPTAGVPKGGEVAPKARPKGGGVGELVPAHLGAE